MAKNITLSQYKELLEMHENTLIKIFNERFKQIESDLIFFKEENKQLKLELNEANKTMGFLSEKYEEIKETLAANKTKFQEQNKTSIKNHESELLIDKMAELEDRSRRNNLRFEGIEETEGETWENCEEKIKLLLKGKLGIDKEITIERAHRTGKNKNEDTKRKRTIVAKFLNFKDRESILLKYKKMKLWNEKLFINEDYSERTINIRKQLFTQAKELRLSGKFAKVVYNKLITKSSE
jgi:hypothetical protein